VLRGGAFNNNPQNVRCAVRNDINARNANNNVGFRVVLSVEPGQN
jgi:formylglycine-generating enzyme required for sulfatase activity